MRVLAVVLSCLLLPIAAAEARPSPRAPARQHRSKPVKRVAIDRPAPAAAAEPQPLDPYADDPAAAPEPPEPPEPATTAAPAPAQARAPAPRPVGRGQSIGAPWNGRLQGATRLQLGERAHIRRPYRAFGTKTTVEHVRGAVRATLAAFPRTHDLAIGDISAERGGWISEHSSHRSGRDIDLGLFYKRKPAGYPESFVRATDKNLDRAATWGLLVNLLESHGKDGGVQVIFLDYDVQSLLYNWARENGVKPRSLDQIFQYPHGKGTSNGVVHHEPNHADHFHVRFRCAKADADCY
jgi:hypothetical protein